MTSEPVPVIMALLSPDHLENPYATYARLRAERPVAPIPEMNAWIVTRHDDVRSVFKDDRFGVAFDAFQVMRAGPGVKDEPYFRVGKDLLVCNDPPVHSRLRRVFREPFTPARVRDLAATVEEICTSTLEPLVAAGGGDVNADFSAKLPLATISALLDVPVADQAQVGQWVYDFAPVLEIGPMEPDQVKRVNAAVEGLEGYFTALVAERRATPGTDFVSAVIAANDADAQPMSEAEIVNNLSLLYFAGQDTQKYQFTNMVGALAANPDALRWLIDDPARVDGAMRELYRYDTAGQFMGRTALEDVELRGETVAAGETVMVCMGGANRDPDVFSAPDELRLDRDEADANVTFGAGRHRCIGVHLAQMQLPIMLRAFLAHARDLEVDLDAAVRHPSIATRGYDTLPFHCAA